ncbi:MAG: homocysteine biosynthesis protein [Pseudomonadota bacterium]
MAKTYEEINEKIGKKEAVVVTAEEMIGIVEENGAKEAARKVDVVTTGTFGPMCSSGALINAGHTTPRMKIQKAWLNGVPACCGIAAIDMYIGATELPEDDPLNKVYPGRFEYGGGPVIEDLVRGKDVKLKAAAYGTDCYPRRELETLINLRDLNTAQLLNPRNGYQNYNVAVNAFGRKPIYTYMGILRPKMANANYCSAGQLSPLLNDPEYRTIGIGTRIFLGGATGYVFYHGTQHNPGEERTAAGVPMGGAGTIAVTGDLKKMSAEYLRGVSITGYGASLAVGIGIPIPILDEDMARFTAVRDSDIFAPVVDYSRNYGLNEGGPLAHVSYEELRSGSISVNGKKTKTSALSSYAKARKIAEILKQRIASGGFLLGKPVELLPGPESGAAFKPLAFREVKKNQRV